MLALILEIQIGERQLLDLAEAGRPSTRLARRLDCRQQKTDQNTDDGYDDQKFNECETRRLMTGPWHEKNSPRKMEEG